MPDQVAKVAVVLSENADLIYSVFTTYASMNGEPTLMTLNSYLHFVADCQLASKASRFVSPKDLDLVFVTVDSAREQAVDSAALADLSSMIEIPKGVDAKSHRRSPALDRDDASRRQKALGRVQFTVALLHIAIRRYVLHMHMHMCMCMCICIWTCICTLPSAGTSCPV